MLIEPALLVYVAPLVLIWVLYLGARKRGEIRSLARRAESHEAGLNTPPSLHPKIDLTRCLGCGACVTACPEGRIIGLVNGKAELIEPSECIGHGACKAACPQGAISLVFGTEERGVELPVVGPDFQTNVSGLYIAGELGGMGLIRNAIEQGRQAMAQIARLPRGRGGGSLDVIIVGGGPAGISASLAAIESRLRFVTLEQDSFGGTVAHFPRGKIVMTEPVTLPLLGQLNVREISKEDLLALWRDVARQTGLQIRYGERAERVVPQADGFEVVTARGVYRSRTVLLSIGRRGTPRPLGVPGEESSKVVYRLADPEQYRGHHVLVVGGGDSALEAAASLAEVGRTTVTLSYRGEAFSRAKRRNRERIAGAEKAGRASVMLSSNVLRIEREMVAIEWRGRAMHVRNDAVIVCAGGILPTHFLRETGVSVETKYGTA